MTTPSVVTIKKAYFDTKNGQQLHYRFSKLGTSMAITQPSVLLLHMSASSSKSCVALMQELSSRGFFCFAPDMPGFGESFNPKEDPKGIEWYSELYYEFFSKQFEFVRGCHIIGHHSGAVIGIDLVARYPGFVESLTLVGPAIMSADERRIMADKTMSPFDKPVADGSHLTKTWNYLLDHGIPSNNVELQQRELLDHARAWRGRMQIYACVWAYDCAAALGRIAEDCKIMALCARDDVLWPYFGNVKGVRKEVHCQEIKGANFGADLGTYDILDEFLAVNRSKDTL